jgi:hypothetical protein
MGSDPDPAFVARAISQERLTFAAGKSHRPEKNAVDIQDELKLLLLALAPSQQAGAQRSRAPNQRQHDGGILGGIVASSLRSERESRNKHQCETEGKSWPCHLPSVLEFAPASVVENDAAIKIVVDCAAFCARRSKVESMRNAFALDRSSDVRNGTNHRCRTRWG